ncbi:MAG: SPOR domain-containing protein [Bacteroidales bacterium]|nr:SPOR domain-containing protein [Bacteroidales bacterium]
MNILNYLREVLLFSEKVILPGFGSLKIEKESAILSGKKLSPPQSKLIFDASETMDDELLSTQVSKAEEISIEEAKQKILEFIDEIRFSLDKGERYIIPELCAILRDENNNITIEKDPELILDYENFGLDSFELDDFEDDSISLEDEESKDLIESEKLSEGAQETDTTHQNQSEKLDEKKDADSKGEEILIAPPSLSVRKNNRSTVWVVVGAIVVMVAAIVIIPLKTNLLENDIDFDSFFGTKDFVIDDDFSEAEEGEFNFDQLVSEFEKDIDSVTSIENAMNPDVAVAEQENIVSNSEFFIIAGSFKEAKNAAELQKELVFEGYPALTLDLGNGIYRVSAISFSNKNDALNALIAFRESMNMSGAWLMSLE